jgi:hypothetical protein
LENIGRLRDREARTWEIWELENGSDNGERERRKGHIA